jgi:ferredoxin--NADP+ reductase
MHLVSPAQPAIGVVVSNERCTAGRKSAGFVRHVAIDVSQTALAGNFVSGQSFGVIPPGTDPKGIPHKVRLYSIASPTRGEDGRGNVLATTVKRLIDEHHETSKLFLGVASNFLCDLKPGDPVRVSGPNGKRFVLPADPSAHDYVFFATGTGIAPFRGMLHDLARAPGSPRVTLVMGVPYATDLLYHDEVNALAAQHMGVRYLTAFSRESQVTPNGARPLYVQDRIQLDDELRATLQSPRTLVYVCGIAGMELGILQALARVLNPQDAEQYLHADAAAIAEVSSWTRRMLHKQVKITRRVFLEVY